MPVTKISPVIFLLLFQLAADAAERVQETYAPATVDMELKRVSEHVWFVEGSPGVATDNQGGSG
jgi:hypothetical protein